MTPSFENFAITVDEKLFSDLLEDMPDISQNIIDRARKADPEYIFDIAMLYHLEGKYSKAFRWLQISAAMGYTESYLSIAQMFISGQHVGRDFEMGERWCSLAMAQGNIDASATIGSIYAERGEDQVALDFYRASAHQGSSFGEFLLGDAYKFGRGVPRDDKIAFEWLLKSAEKDYFFAQYMVGDMLERGEGVDLDLDKALVWFHKCSSSGFGLADARIENLNRRGHFYQPEN